MKYRCPSYTLHSIKRSDEYYFIKQNKHISCRYNSLLNMMNLLPTTHYQTARALWRLSSEISARFYVAFVPIRNKKTFSAALSFTLIFNLLMISSHSFYETSFGIRNSSSSRIRMTQLNNKPSYNTDVSMHLTSSTSKSWKNKHPKLQTHASRKPVPQTREQQPLSLKHRTYRPNISPAGNALTQPFSLSTTRDSSSLDSPISYPTSLSQPSNHPSDSNAPPGPTPRHANLSHLRSLRRPPQNFFASQLSRLTSPNPSSPATVFLHVPSSMARGNEVDEYEGHSYKYADDNDKLQKNSLPQNKGTNSKPIASGHDGYRRSDSSGLAAFQVKDNIQNRENFGPLANVLAGAMNTAMGGVTQHMQGPFMPADTAAMSQPLPVAQYGAAAPSPYGNYGYGLQGGEGGGLEDSENRQLTVAMMLLAFGVRMAVD